MATRCPCAVPGPCVGRPADADLAGAARVTGRDGKRIMAATLTWLMPAYSELTKRLGFWKRILSI
ncbi:MAG: hypothetical protein ABIQ24_12850 [Nitrospiraceae bacterium]